MKREDFRIMEAAALQARVGELTRDYFVAREAISSGQESNYAKLGQMRRSIARAKTILKQKQGV